MRSVAIALLAAVGVAVAVTAARWPALLVVLPVFILAAPFAGHARVLLAAVAAAAVVAVSLILWSLPWAFALAIRPAIAMWRFARSSPATRRHYPAVIWARVRWRWLARNCGLAPMDYKTHHAARGEWAPMDPLSRTLLWARGPEGAHMQVVARMHYPGQVSA